jgi:hypothetical protein
MRHPAGAVTDAGGGIAELAYGDTAMIRRTNLGPHGSPTR